MFWAAAIAIGVLAAGFMAWPLLRERKAMRNYGLALVLSIPVLALFMYKDVGAPDGIGVTGKPQQQQRQQQAGDHATTGGGQMTELLGGLEQRLQENPADLEGWLLLGRTYKTVQQYEQAEAALIRASQLAPNDSLIMVELAEAKLFNSGNPVIGDDVRGMLERALILDPDQQKGLWLLGISASQAGNDALAVELWERLVAQMDPASPMAVSVQQQLEQVRSRLGVEPAEDEGWNGLQVEIQAGDPVPELPPTAALFVIVRNPAAPNPPLGVMRIPSPGFPVNAVLTDANSMMQEMPISGVAEIELLARLSMSGNPVTQAGDMQSETLMTAVDADTPVQLVLRSD